MAVSRQAVQVGELLPGVVVEAVGQHDGGELPAVGRRRAVPDVEAPLTDALGQASRMRRSRSSTASSMASRETPSLSV